MKKMLECRVGEYEEGRAYVSTKEVKERLKMLMKEKLMRKKEKEKN